MSEPKPAYVSFEVRAVEDRTASIEGGAYATKDVIFAIITPAGTRDRIEKVATEWIENLEEGVRQERIPHSWLEAYRHAYKTFETSRENPEFGHSITNWPAVSPAQSKALLDANLRTVEELADANEEALGRIGMGARALKAKAQAWLDAAGDTGKTAAELAALREKNEVLEARDKERDEEFKKMQAQLAALEASMKTKEKA